MSQDRITKSARGEECQIRLPDVCNFNPETSVWCHAGGADIKGVGQQADSLLGAVGCSDCHDVYDRRRKPPFGMTRDDVELAFWRGHARSLLLPKVRRAIAAYLADRRIKGLS